MLSNIGVPGLILILVIALVIFGPKKLPEIGKAIGQTLTEFKKTTKDLTSDITEPIEEIRADIKKPVDDLTAEAKKMVSLDDEVTKK